MLPGGAHPGPLRHENVSKLFGRCEHCGKTVLSENYGAFIKPLIDQNGWETFYDTSAFGYVDLEVLSCGRWIRTMMDSRKICWMPCTRRRLRSELLIQDFHRHHIVTGHKPRNRLEQFIDRAAN